MYYLETLNLLDMCNRFSVSTPYVTVTSLYIILVWAHQITALDMKHKQCVLAYGAMNRTTILAYMQATLLKAGDVAMGCVSHRTSPETVAFTRLLAQGWRHHSRHYP